MQNPNFEKPEEVVKFRKELGAENFVNFLVDNYQKIKRDSLSSDIEFQKKTRRLIERNVDLAKKIAGRNYKINKQKLSGIIATMGGVTGDIYGAMLGGIGSKVIPMVAEQIDKKRVYQWSNYFIGRCK